MPVTVAMKVKKLGMSSVWPGGVKREARRERKSGESPKMERLVPEAIPINRGKVLVAAKTTEKYLLQTRK